MDDTTIERAIRQPRRYWYEDGLGEVSTGTLFLLIAALFWSEASGVLPSGASSLALIAVVFLGVSLSRRLIAAMKARLTFPRTGLVTYRRPARYRRRTMRAFLLATGVAVLFARFAFAALPLAWIPFLDGLIFGAFLASMARDLSLARFYALAAVSVLSGVVAALFAQDDLLGSALFFGLLGAALVVSGAVTLANYLRRPVPPAAD